MRTLGTLAIVVAFAWLLVACGVVMGPDQEPTAGGNDIIPGRYIVTLKNSGVSTSSARDLATTAARVSDDHRATPGRLLRLINGFVAEGLDEADVVSLRADRRVESVEPDVMLHVQNTQTNAVWNLDRIDQRTLPLNGVFNYGPTGAGVTVYVVDTGIRSTHEEFVGRMLPGYTAFSDGYGTEDCHSHGTHVAGIVAGTRYGVAKNAKLVPVRVMGCTGSGSASGIIAGLDWIAATRTGPSVVNMSLGGSPSSALDTAVRNLVASGVTVVLAAGNSNQDACEVSPARVGEAVTVGATVSHDVRSSYSNYGTCLALFAPGSAVQAALHDGDASYGLKSGTSMAAPHVAGVAALVLQGTPSAAPADVARWVLDMATRDVLGNVGVGSPNLLLFADPAMEQTPAPAPDPEPDPDPDPDPDPVPAPDPDPDPDPEPGRPSGPPCIDCELFTGALAGSGDANTWPRADGSGYVSSSRTGMHQGWLIGPADADFDLLLETWQGNRWRVVASSAGAGSLEELHYVGRAGTYRWRVVSQSGSGTYELYLSLP